MATFRTICVYCGSRPGRDASFATAAHNLGTALANRGIGLVYGGASVGLMGVMADAALKAGGEVFGVITASLADHEIAHSGLTSLDVVETMHQRKARMAALADAFIMLPGGFGTFEEFFEVITWAQLGIHAKPCGVLNVDGFFDGLLRFMDHSVEKGFIRSELAGRIVVAADSSALLEALADLDK